MQFVKNSPGQDHLKVITNVFDNAQRILFAVAFLKHKGLKEIDPILAKRLAAGAEIEAFVGRDFCLTEPSALERLLELSKQFSSLKIYVAKQLAQSTFHPKVYIGIKDGQAHILIGSANLTGGALSKNEEISILFTCRTTDSLFKQKTAMFQEYRSKIGGRFEVLDYIVLEQYRLQFNRAQRIKKRVEQEIESEFEDLFNLDLLAEYYKEFLQDGSQMVSLRNRRQDRIKAKAVQTQIAGIPISPPLDHYRRVKLGELFRNLITSANGHSHLWQSGDVHRRGLEALNKPTKLIRLFDLAQTAADLAAEEGYRMLREPARALPGAGINMVTEMLCTFAPKRFAVFNGNTADALKALGADVPNAGTLIATRTYARICAIIDAVRERIGGSDFTDADAFLNWVYQTKVKPNS